MESKSEQDEDKRDYLPSVAVTPKMMTEMFDKTPRVKKRGMTAFSPSPITTDPYLTPFGQIVRFDFLVKRRDKGFKSMFQLVQTPLGGSFMLIPGPNAFAIPKFTNLKDFSLSRLSLFEAIKEEYEAISSKPDLDTETAIAKQTVADQQGINVKSIYVNQYFAGRRTNTPALVLNAYKNRANISKDVDQITSVNPVTGGTLVQPITLIRESSLCLLHPEEFRLMSDLEQGYIAEFFVNGQSWIDYLNIFCAGKPFRSLRDIATRLGQTRYPIYSMCPVVKVNTNIQTAGDVMPSMRDVIIRVVFNEAKRLFDSVDVQINAVEAQKTLSGEMHISATRDSELNQLVRNLASSKDKDMFAKVATSIVLSRWVRLTDNRPEMDGSMTDNLLRTYDIWCKVAMASMRSFPMLLVRNEEVYLVCFFFSYYDPSRGNNPSLYTVSTWMTGPLSGVDHPIKYALDNGNIGLKYLNTFRALFEVDDIGHGYIGGGVSVGNVTAVSTKANLYTIQREIESVTGVGYNTSMTPITYTQMDRLSDFCNCITDIIASKSAFSGRLNDFKVMAGVLKKMIPKLVYYGAMLEMFNYYFHHTGLCAPASDDISVKPTLFVPDYTVMSLYSTESWAQVNSSLFKEAGISGYSTINYNFGAFFNLLQGSDWALTYTKATQECISYDFIHSGLTMNYDLRCLAELISRNQIYLPVDHFKPKDCVVLALNEWTSVFKPMIIDHMAIGSYTGYFPIDGILYSLVVYSKIDTFVRSFRPFMGFASSFIYAGQSILEGQRPAALSIFSYSNLTTTNPVKIVTEREARERRISESNTENVDALSRWILPVPIKNNMVVEKAVIKPFYSIAATSQDLFVWYEQEDADKNVYQCSVSNADALALGYAVGEFEPTYTWKDDTIMASSGRMKHNMTYSITEWPFLFITIEEVLAWYDFYDAYSDQLIFAYPPEDRITTGLTEKSVPGSSSFTF